jgi:hypothetical protein
MDVARVLAAPKASEKGRIVRGNREVAMVGEHNGSSRTPITRPVSVVRGRPRFSRYRQLPFPSISR